jgi:hypothetical protein
MWSRVFGRSDVTPEPAALLGHLRSLGLPYAGQFRGDDLGWTGGELIVQAGATPVDIERYLTATDDLRDDLNTWAAWLETQDHEPRHRTLMEDVVATRQLITIRRPPDRADEATLDRVCTVLCQWLATRTDGVYQVDGGGFFAADGTLLLHEH